MKIYRLKKLFSTPKDAASLPEERRRRRRLDAALGGGLLLAMLLSPLAGFGQQCAQVRQDVLRLHILANSDSPEDQALKLQVRDAVLLETEDLFSGAATLAQAQADAQAVLRQAEEQIRQTVEQYGQLHQSFEAALGRITGELRGMDAAAAQLPERFNSLKAGLEELLEQAKEQ